MKLKNLNNLGKNKIFRKYKAMPKIVLKQKYRGKKDASVVVSSNRKIVLKNKYRKPKVNVRRLANQVARINMERKDSGWIASTEIVVGQVIGSAANAVQSGHYTTSLAPTPSQGDSGSQREGDSISITGMYNKFQFAQQSNALQHTRGKIIFATPRFSSYSSVVSGATTQGIETLLKWRNKY